MTSGPLPTNEPLSIPQQVQPGIQPTSPNGPSLAPGYADTIGVSLVNGMIVVSMFGPSQSAPGGGLNQAPVATVALTPASAAALSQGLQQVLMAPVTASASEEAVN